MATIFSVFVTLVVLCLIFGLAFWIVTLLGGVLPAPIRQPVTTVLMILLALLAIACLADLTGVFGARHALIHVNLN